MNKAENRTLKIPQYIITDWAGNELLRWGKFNSFDDAWDFILGELTDILGLEEEDYQDYFVIKEDEKCLKF